MDRDPRIDPRPGDMVCSTRHKDGRERHVVRRDGNNIYYLTVTVNKTSDRKCCWITTWQDWCRANSVEISQLARV